MAQEHPELNLSARMVEAFDQFAQHHPGYRSVLSQLIDLMTVADASKFIDTSGLKRHEDYWLNEST